VESPVHRILEWILGETVWKGVDWVCPAQGNNKWRALVDTVMNLRVQQDAWNLLNS